MSDKIMTRMHMMYLYHTLLC